MELAQVLLIICSVFPVSALMGCPQNILYGRGQKVNTAAKALPISAARPDPGRRGYAWAAVLTYSPRPFTIFRGRPIGKKYAILFNYP